MNKLLFFAAFIFSAICFAQDQGVVIFEQNIEASEAMQEFSYE